VVHVLKPPVAAAKGGTIAQLAPEDWILIDASGPEAEQALLTLLHELPPNRIAVVEGDENGFGPEIRTARMAHQRHQEGE